MSLKDSIEENLIQCYHKEYSGNVLTHPIKIAQSLKSLIGINPEKPNQILIEYIPKYLDKFPEKQSNNEEIIQVEYFASMINLEILLNEQNYSKAKNEVLRLLQVSSGEPILELFLNNFLNSPLILPVINSIYRSVKFCNGREVKNALLIILEILEEYQNEELTALHHLDYSSQLLEISNTKFIRNEKIQNELQKIDYPQLYKHFNNQQKSNLGIEFIKKGREFILEIVNENPSILENDKNIILLDSVRTLLRYRKDTEFDNLIHFVAQKIEYSIG